jgi:tetratricopeptide (TPR) repeat protein/peroxiredoxin
VPAGLRRFALPELGAFGPQNASTAEGQFHLHPHYRAQLPLEATLLKVQAGSDEFVTEKYHDQIAATLTEWTSGLLKSPQQVQPLAKVLSPDFAGCSFRPVASRLVRPGPALEIHVDSFSTQSTLGRDAFLQEFRSTLSPFSKMVTAEFQVTGIDAGPLLPQPPTAPGRLRTRVLYGLVGTGNEFYREQRVGQWELEWEASSGGEFRLRKWLAREQTRSRSTEPVYTEITERAFGKASSYSSQLLLGADHWRTVLDGACGIDVYAHNGISIGDIDGDGLDDLYVCQPGGLPNRLYRNRGDGTFEDITEGSGLGILENTACALFADFDNDGRQDVIVVRTDGPLLFFNEGNGKFRQRPKAFRFASPPQGTFTGAAVADYDRDGWLDIYFCLYIYYRGADQYKYPYPYYAAENGPPNFLMRNNRDGTFRDVTGESGLDQNNTRYSFCCGWNDYNLDGWPDLYVVNDFGRKNLYRNNGDGTFADVAAEAGVEDVGAGMSVCWFDYNNDGLEDLYVADMWTAAGQRISTQEIFLKDTPEKIRALYRKHAMGNSLFRNNGDGSFQDTSVASGVAMGRWSWSSDSWDFDHDGFPDLYVTNGMVSAGSREDLNSFFWRQVVARSPLEAQPSSDYEQGWNAVNELIRSDATWSGYERNVFYVNNRDGTFSDASGTVGLDFLEDGRAFALADFDQDGRLEVFLKNRNGPQLRLLKNVMKDLPPSIAFRLRGHKSNRDAIGAVVTVETEASHWTRSLQAGSGYLSQHSKELFFGLGETKGAVRAKIRWPSGLVQEIRELPLNCRVWVEEGQETPRIEPFKRMESWDGQAGLVRAKEIKPLSDRVETWLLAPVSAPDFSLPDLRGQTRTLAALRGKIVLADFFVLGSARCKRDLATLNRLQGLGALQGLRACAINVDEVADAAGLEALAREQDLSFPILIGSADVTGIYNILYRYLFDRHRDLCLPTSFLISADGDIVKVYQGPLNPEHVEQDLRQIPRTFEERLAKGLPFFGITDTTEFLRNYLSYGSVFFQRGYLEQAEASFQRALRDEPTAAEAVYGLGSVYLKQDKPKEARENFERAVNLHASYPDTLANSWNNLGLLATGEGRIPEAIRYFQKAVELSPDHLIALRNLGNAYRQQKRWEDARKTLERALAVGPRDAEVNYSLGMVFAQIDDTDRAYEYLQRALKFRPAYPEALNNLGVLYLRTRRPDEAVASFKESIRIAPSFDQSYLNLARVYSLEGEPDKARAVLLELLKQHPGHVQAEAALAELPR